ncbi:retrovirus-related pol polyprotein from transposon TNT 1-94 [Tanacetum coccineum]
MMERKMGEWSKSQNISLEQTDWTEPQPPPQAQTEQVNVVFTGSGKSDYFPKIQKDPPPSIIVNNKIKKDRPIKTSKGNYHIVKTNEYPFRLELMTRYRRKFLSIDILFPDINQICLGVDLEPDEWIKDSRCSKHMTGKRKLFSTYKAYNGGNVIFGSNLRGKICDNKCRVTFSEHDSEITKDGKIIGKGIRKKGLYVMKLRNKPKDKICLATIDENSTLWHRRLGHANMRLIQSLASKELVRNLPMLKFDQHFCDA